MLFSKPKAFLGVDFGAGGIKVVELRQEKNRPMLYTYGFTAGEYDIHSFFGLPKHKNFEPLREKTAEIDRQNPIDPKKVEEYANLVRSVCKAAKTVSNVATVSLPVSVIFHAILNLPVLKKEELEGVVKAEINKLSPRPVDEMVLDYQILEQLSTKKMQKVLVNAVPKELIQFYSQVFARAGLKLDSLEPESVALARSLVGRDNSVVMIVDLGAERTNFYIVDQGVALTHHSIEVGGVRINKILNDILGLEPGQIEQAKYDLFDRLIKKSGSNIVIKEEFFTNFSSVIDPIIKEIEYSFDTYIRQVGNEEKRPEKVILTGGAGNLPYLTDYIADKFQLKCYVGDPWGRVVYQDGLKPLLHKIGSRMSVAIGLALRNLV